MMNYWMAVASREHVLRGKKGGFAQVCHGKAGPLKRMQAGDWLVYYSPTEQFGKECLKPEPCRKFTAIGKIVTGEVYQFQMSENFIPWRIDVAFVAAEEAAIVPLINSLTFIHDKQRWGYPFRRGCFAIPSEDFHLIASSMGVLPA